MFKGFKEFLLRGNVVDLAVAVVIGAAFNTVVEKVVAALFNPIIGLFLNADSFDKAAMVPLPNGDHIAFGVIIGSVINFLIVAAVVYFVFVLPMNKLRPKAEEAPAGPDSEELLAEIRDLLREQGQARSAAAPQAPAPGSTPGEGTHRH
ncbi:large conductance mechanosensitive channel protein MscL [Leucobacter sp. CSA2]|uniref:Large-conductance mechanosensitive channel n=1 Tax=Leucobacter edaphi TaxID=2796472 RepID=A0A934UYE4_9MICO|nr:large conductance mechanosensitive channel protein MscL [Leucobacter edaphi]MBK0422433.1 large conductance mechanosensitive channel protein MscL [Leucobacter edaphi]